MKFEHVAIVHGTPEDAFALTQDYARRLAWDPFLRRAELIGGATEPGVGVRAWCVARSGMGMETEYVSFAPPRIAAVKMTRGPWMLESFGGAWEFSPAGANETAVSFRYQLRTRPRWLRWLLEPLARRWFSRETRKRVVALQAALAALDRGVLLLGLTLALGCTQAPQLDPAQTQAVYDGARDLLERYPQPGSIEASAWPESVRALGPTSVRSSAEGLYIVTRSRGVEEAGFFVPRDRERFSPRAGTDPEYVPLSNAVFAYSIRG